MLISTRGRYALRVMIDLAEHDRGSYIPLKDIAARQEISLKYIEGIMTDLTRAGLLDGQHGKGGGYRLDRPPDVITVLEILETTEGSMAPVSCLGTPASPCSRAAECRTLPMWEKLYGMIRDYFEGIALSDLMKTDAGSDYYVI
jgi:Rrf2 family protein